MLSLYNGGAEKSLVNLLNELPKEKYDIDVLLFRKEGMFLKQVPEYINVVDTPYALKALYAPLKKSGKYCVVKFIGTLISRIFEKDRPCQAAFRWKFFYSKHVARVDKVYDVAIAYISGEILYFVGDKIDAHKKLVWIHNDYRAEKQPKKYDYPYLKQFDGIVSVSDKCINILKDEFTNLKNKLYNIANITSSEVVWKRADEFFPKEYEECENIIVSIGRLCEQKGFDMAIEAASIMKKRGQKFKWFVIGSGELEKKLREASKQEDVEDCFVFLGVRANPYPYIKNCTVFAQTSRFEGKSVVLDEAKILCVPILVTAYDTVNDQIRNESEGMIVNMNPLSIADGMKMLLNSEETRNKMREYLSQNKYSNQHEVYKYMKLFD